MRCSTFALLGSNLLPGVVHQVGQPRRGHCQGWLLQLDPFRDSAASVLGPGKAAVQNLKLGRFAFGSEGLRPAGGSCYLSTVSEKAALRPSQTSWRGCAHQLGSQTLMAHLQRSWRDLQVGSLVLQQYFAVGACPRAASLRPSQVRHSRHHRASLLSSYQFCHLIPSPGFLFPSLQK
mgnify:CR=1 FL=1